MKADNQVLTDSKAFALRIIRLYNYLKEEKQVYVLSKQILRSGTSIGANIRESVNAQSRMDFINKLNIALKEANETEYWLISYFINYYSVGTFGALCAAVTASSHAVA